MRDYFVYENLITNFTSKNKIEKSNFINFIIIDFSDGSRKVGTLDQTGQRANHSQDADLLCVPPSGSLRANGTGVPRLWHAKYH